jgi:diguanylate cyclase (GGDEF)-like protein
VLFSSDIFGGFTIDRSLVAKDESHFEALRPFHEHYMPSRDLLAHGLMRLEQLPLALIAPQHGALIPEHLIRQIIEKLKGLDCGLYLMARDDSDISRLLQLNRMLREVLDTMVLYRDFRDVAKSLLILVENLLPARSLDFYIDDEQTDGVLHFGAATRYRGNPTHMPEICREVFGLDRRSLREKHPAGYYPETLATSAGLQPALIIPLLRPDQQQVHALAVVLLREQIKLTEELNRLLDQISVPLGVAIERERIYRILELERKEIYETSIRDDLTGLYTRVYMQETLRRQFARHDRDPDEILALVMFDIDHFKRINDTWGHVAGDEVLRRVCEMLRANIRGTDLGVRLGGEEFAVVLVGPSAQQAPEIADRIRTQVSQLTFSGALADCHVTISAGIAYRRRKEELEALLNRADNNLYHAKRSGRDRVITEEYAAVSA